MYDIKPLEEEWKKYRKKKRKPFVFAGVLIFFLAAGSAVLYYTKDIHTVWGEKNSTLSEPKIEKKVFSLTENKSLDRLETRKSEELKTVESDANTDEIVEDLPLRSEGPVRKKPRVKMNIITTEMPKAKKRQSEEKHTHKRKYLVIKETSSFRAYKEVAARFRETKDTDDSLFLARTYYNLKKYKKAEYWALQTNNVNSNLEESILIFAKAKVKLGHKNEAIRILSKYIKNSNSPEAKVLLKQIKKGKL